MESKDCPKSGVQRVESMKTNVYCILPLPSQQPSLSPYHQALLEHHVGATQTQVLLVDAWRHMFDHLLVDFHIVEP